MLVGLLFAGCVDRPDPTDADDPSAPGRQSHGAGPGAEPKNAGPVDAPVWGVGDWWSYQIVYTSGESYSAKVVVHAVDAAGYHVTADDRELVLRAAFTHYPTFGAVSTTDLSQTIHGQKVQYLRFPLEAENWTGTFRDTAASYTTARATLETGRGPVDGFVTTVRDTDQGFVILSNGYSPEAKWFTNFTFDFDGVAPPDVTYTLVDWGANHTGTVPVLEVVDGVHRTFPTVAFEAPNPSEPQAVPPPLPDVAASRDTMEVTTEGASLLWGIFAGAGGQGVFEFDLAHKDSATPPQQYRWQPTGPDSLFDWGEIAAAPVGEWDVLCTGAAEGFAFLFCETYEVRTTDVTL